MLVFQIAAGIVLGVVVLVYHKHLFAAGKVLGAFLLVAIFLGVLIWGVAEAPSFLSLHSVEIFEKLRTIGGVSFGFICLGAGSYGLGVLLGVISKFGSYKLTQNNLYQLFVKLKMNLYHLMSRLKEIRPLKNREKTIKNK